MIKKINTLMILLVLHGPLFAASHHPQTFLKSIENTPEEGKAIVQHYCAICHAEHPQIALGAPRMHHPEDWKSRLKQGKKRLFEHTDEGMGAMPARGGCFECTDKQLKKAIQSMLALCTGEKTTEPIRACAQ